ncbi:NAD(P)-dependent oxidoreductase [Clostridium uliginosum]|uniref:precorrin-2 dehydrogenase n=1 Tax=Clostridium uliginosum TaxID=119641 RepID=A0A1I1LT89_9CLOT|nr:NAD(P)-dependent oxidoreductase [Clostridium uliginosum]SFC76477.1 precorrin-2 dehydrogenase / sirohydrochlorin ferrochelatase [Clostridium uliginosum]
MSEDNREDFHDEEVEYSFISLLSSKIKVGVIGGGRAGLLKIRHFIKTGCCVEVLSKEFNQDVIDLSKNSNDKLKLVKKNFSYDFLKDKHIVLITIDDKSIIDKITNYCEENCKIYIDSSHFINGMGVVPIQRSLKNITFALNTKGGNPKGAVLLSNKVSELLMEYDDFIGFTTRLRNRAKLLLNDKKDIINFIGTEDFKYFYDKGKSDLVLRMYFLQETVEYLIKSR